MTVRDALFDADTIVRRRGSKALVPTDPNSCPKDGALLITVEAVQPALFRHGGYGETKRGVVRFCPSCRWVGGSEQRSENPRRLS